MRTARRRTLLRGTRSPGKLRNAAAVVAVALLARTPSAKVDPKRLTSGLRRAGEPAPAENADVATYFSSFAPTIPQCANKHYGSAACVHVDEDGRIVHSRDLAKDPGSAKQMLMDKFLRDTVAILQRTGRWPRKWMSFLMVYTAAGPHRKEDFPVFGFGKRDPRWQPGLLVPNPFFVTPGWWDDMIADQIEESEARPWESRRRQALFRGACGPGALPRLELLRLRDADGLLDVGFTKVDGYKTIRECVEQLARKGGDVTPADIDFVLEHRVLPAVSQRNFSQFRYLVHMPGSATGSYSRNLQYLWAHHSIILIWDSIAVEHYYQYLEAGLHYLPVNQSTVHDTLYRLEADPALQERLRRGARTFATTHLSGDSLVRRWDAVLQILDRRQAPAAADMRAATADAGCTCDDFLIHNRSYTPCAKCDTTKLTGAKLAKFVGVMPKSVWRPHIS